MGQEVQTGLVEGQGARHTRDWERMWHPRKGETLNFWCQSTHASYPLTVTYCLGGFRQVTYFLCASTPLSSKWAEGQDKANASEMSSATGVSVMTLFERVKDRNTSVH